MTKERKSFNIRERESAPLDVLYQRGGKKKTSTPWGKREGDLTEGKTRELQ